MALTDQFINLPDILADFPEISLVYLFGSRVAGQVGPMSDYDVAILVDSPDENLTIQARFQHALVKLLNTERVDVVLLNRAPIELAYHIIASGEPLYQKDVYTRVEYEAHVLSLYGDYLPFLRSNKRQVLSGGENAKRVQRYREALRRTQRTLGQARTSQE
jgi:predicted nucleotidyltransferase